eukprot:GHVR01015985.1.p1 GENE.GHVR01015985.1~~GHVR01015985.1.p1  ORF type:complete len:175 (+),score=66.93 GHVR01015985.1:73-597(+)
MSDKSYTSVMVQCPENDMIMTLGDLCELKCVRKVESEKKGSMYPCKWEFVSIPPGCSFTPSNEEDNEVYKLVCKEHIRLQVDALRSKIDIYEHMCKEAMKELKDLESSPPHTLAHTHTHTNQNRLRSQHTHSQPSMKFQQTHTNRHTPRPPNTHTHTQTHTHTHLKNIISHLSP